MGETKRSKGLCVLWGLCLCLVLGGVAQAQDTVVLSAPVIACQAEVVLEHDPRAFTQGLFFWQGRLFETTGLYGHSSIRELSVQTGRPLRLEPLSDRYFVEGACAVGQEFVALTWRAGRAFRIDPVTFAASTAFFYAGQGWGLTFDGHRLIMSDGSATLTFRDPKSFKPVGQLRVHDKGRSIHRLNELEWGRGEIFANVFGMDRIAVIDPESGAVRRWLDVSAFAPKGRESRAVLNGLAWDDQGGRLFVTGKLWNKMFVLSEDQVTHR